MAEDWRGYQEEVAEYFRGLGFEAHVEAAIKGVRSAHAIDVLVNIPVLDFNAQWLIECKFWKTNVNQEHVLALRTIVADVGADRGILLCETGFQSGAINASNYTNVHLTNLADLRESTNSLMPSNKVLDLFQRAQVCKEEYWKIPKDIRIDNGLRVGYMSYKIYSALEVIEFTQEVLSRALRGVFPFELLSTLHIHNIELPRLYSSPSEVILITEKLILELEEKLSPFRGKF